MGRLSPIVVPEKLAAFRKRDRIFARAVGQGFDVRADGSRTVIDVFDEIGPGAVSPAAFQSKLPSSGDVTVRIDSPGGSVFDGIAIYNLLLQHAGTVEVQVIGVAASAASIVAMAGDKIGIAENAHIMVHNAWALTVGNRYDHSDVSKLLASIDQSLAHTYSKRTGLPISEVSKLMDEETWFAADQAKELGFADEIIGRTEPSARFDLSVYANAPADLRAPLQPVLLSSKAELQKILRNAGLSHVAANKITAGGWPALASKEDPEQTETLSAAIARTNAQLKQLRK